MNVDPVSACFLDGSVPIIGRFARRFPPFAVVRHTEVDRRLVYIDPDSAPPGAPSHRDIPGFFSNLKGALSDLPSAEPVTEGLKRYARQFVRLHRESINVLVDLLAAEIDLDSSNSDVDMLLASIDPKQWHPDARWSPFPFHTTKPV